MVQHKFSQYLPASEFLLNETRKNIFFSCCGCVQRAHRSQNNRSLRLLKAKEFEHLVPRQLG